MRIFLDANILIDHLADRNSGDSNIIEVWKKCYPEDIYLSALSVHVAVYVLKIKYRSVMYNKLQDLLSKISILPLTRDEVTDAINYEYSDYEDTLQYLSAAKYCDFIMTRDIKDFENLKKHFHNKDIKIGAFAPLPD